MQETIQSKINLLPDEQKEMLRTNNMLSKVVSHLKICRYRECNKTVYRKQFCCKEHEIAYRGGKVKNMPSTDPYKDLYIPFKNHYCLEYNGDIVSKNGEPIVFPKAQLNSMKNEIPSDWKTIRADKALKKLVKLNKDKQEDNDKDGINLDKLIDC